MTYYNRNKCIEELYKAVRQTPNCNIRIANAWHCLGNCLLNTDHPINVWGTPYTKVECYIKAIEYGFTVGYSPGSWHATWLSLGHTMSVEDNITVMGVVCTKEQCMAMASMSQKELLLKVINKSTESEDYDHYTESEEYGDYQISDSPTDTISMETALRPRERNEREEESKSIVNGKKRMRESQTSIATDTTSRKLLRLQDANRKLQDEVVRLQTQLEASKQEIIHLSEVKVAMEAKYNDGNRKHQDEVETQLSTIKQETIHLSEENVAMEAKYNGNAYGKPQEDIRLNTQVGVWDITDLDAQE